MLAQFRFAKFRSAKFHFSLVLFCRPFSRIPNQPASDRRSDQRLSIDSILRRPPCGLGLLLVLTIRLIICLGWLRFDLVFFGLVFGSSFGSVFKSSQPIAEPPVMSQCTSHHERNRGSKTNIAAPMGQGCDALHRSQQRNRKEENPTAREYPSQSNGQSTDGRRVARRKRLSHVLDVECFRRHPALPSF